MYKDPRDGLDGTCLAPRRVDRNGTPLRRYSGVHAISAIYTWGNNHMRRATKTTVLLASWSIAALALSGCAGGASDSPAPESTVSVDSSPATEEPAAESSFENSVLKTPEVTIAITDVKTIPVGEPGNEYGDVPVIAFWYEVTNLTAAEVTPSDWFYYFTAFQDNDPNAVNELNVGSLPDDQFLDSQLETIKEGGTVANAVAYELSDTTTPVDLVASDTLGEAEIGKMTFTLD